MPLVAGKSSARDVTPAILHLLREMHELAMLLRRRRFARGALNLDLPEVKLDMNKEGQVTGAHETEHDESHQLIEEFMLAANIAVATELNDRGLSFLRRVHSAPAELKLRALGEFVSILGFPLKNVQSRFDLQRLLQLIRGKPEEGAVSYAILRSLKQAEYSPEAIDHYALAEEQYCHFTSPIRRYPDLLIHRLVTAVLTGNKTGLSPGMEELVRLGSHCSLTERRAERAERELIKLKLLSYMETRVGEQLEAVITGVDRFGFFCRGIEVPAEGLVHISTLPPRDGYEFDRAAMALIARGGGHQYRLGDRVRVEVAQVDVNRRELNYRVIGRGKGGTRTTQRGGRPQQDQSPDSRGGKSGGKKRVGGTRDRSDQKSKSRKSSRRKRR